jgi:hypothetical protein
MQTAGDRKPSELVRGLGLWPCTAVIIGSMIIWQTSFPYRKARELVEQWGDPIGVSVNVQRELSDSVIYKSNGIFITNSYVVRRRFFTFNILRFNDLLWAYKKVTQRHTYFIPTGKSFAAIVIFYGGRETFMGKETQS